MKGLTRVISPVIALAGHLKGEGDGMKCERQNVMPCRCVRHAFDTVCKFCTILSIFSSWIGTSKCCEL